MTVTTASEQLKLRQRVSETASDLYQAKQDVEMYARLQNAAAEVKRLSAEYSEAMSDLRKAEIAAEKEFNATRFKDLEDITVYEMPGDLGGGVLNRQYTIAYTKLAYDGVTSKPKQFRQSGFDAVPQDVMEYLIERHPERIPEAIRNLAPGDPRKAFALYFIGKRRGYISGAAA